MTVDTDSLARDDVISLSRSQTTSVTIDVATPSQVYSVDLLINEGDVRTFSYTALVGDDVDAVAAGLEAELLQAQTKYAVERAGATLMLAGPLGEAFDVTVAADMSAALFEAAISATDPDGLQIGHLRVVVPDSVVGLPPRRFATRTVPDGVLVERHRIICQEIGGGRRFDVDSSEILTLVKKVVL